MLHQYNETHINAEPKLLKYWLTNKISSNVKIITNNNKNIKSNKTIDNNTSNNIKKL